MAEFTWSPVLETGVPKMDAQHRVLIGWMNRFAEAAGRGDSSAAIRALDALALATASHFRDEEAMMARRQIRGRESHVAIHKELVRLLGELSTAYVSGPTAERGERLSRFLQTWLRGHILGVDRAYKPVAEVA